MPDAWQLDQIKLELSDHGLHQSAFSILGFPEHIVTLMILITAINL